MQTDFLKAFTFFPSASDGYPSAFLFEFGGVLWYNYICKVGGNMKDLIKVNTFTDSNVVGADGKNYPLDYNGFLTLLFSASRNAYIKADGCKTTILIVSSR